MTDQDLKKCIIAFSPADCTEFYLADISQIHTDHGQASISDWDFVFSPFDLTRNKRFLFNFGSLAYGRKFSCQSEKNSSDISSNFATYKLAYKAVQAALANKNIDKIVLSKKVAHEAKYADLYDLFIKLKNKYKTAYTYLIHLPNIGTWIGATPELLLEENEDHFLTRAIAGTQTYTAVDIETSWGEKEKEEHQIIERHLNEALKEVNIQNEITQPYTKPAGHICHIASDIKIDKNIDLGSLLKIIHPGPALNGYPLDTAKQHINNIETHDRKYYCGYLGGKHQDDKLRLYANIRCMEVFRNQYELYVGGGITKDSNLDDEWTETELKAQTLKSVLTDDLSLET